jgi:hypothetical protein
MHGQVKLVGHCCFPLPLFFCLGGAETIPAIIDPASPRSTSQQSQQTTSIRLSLSSFATTIDVKEAPLIGTIDQLCSPPLSRSFN